jgi:predicted nucleic acid-binding protein
VLSHYLLEELSRTLAKPQFRTQLTSEQSARAFWTFQMRAEIVPITVSVSGVATHPEDDVVLAGAVSANVDFLVTGDSNLRKVQSYQGVTILTPREFLTVLEQAESLPED